MVNAVYALSVMLKKFVILYKGRILISGSIAYFREEIGCLHIAQMCQKKMGVIFC